MLIAHGIEERNMTEILRKKLNESAAMRWTVLAFVAFTMFCGYYITDVMAPLMDMLGDEFAWTSEDFGWFNSAYSWINVMLFMLVIGGMILDAHGPQAVYLFCFIFNSIAVALYVLVGLHKKD